MRIADEATSKRHFEIVAVATLRLSVTSEAAHAAHLVQLIEADALTESAFALINLELPHWKLRRIAT